MLCVVCCSWCVVVRVVVCWLIWSVVVYGCGVLFFVVRCCLFGVLVGCGLLCLCSSLLLSVVYRCRCLVAVVCWWWFEVRRLSLFVACCLLFVVRWLFVVVVVVCCSLLCWAVCGCSLLLIVVALALCVVRRLGSLCVAGWSSLCVVCRCCGLRLSLIVARCSLLLLVLVCVVVCCSSFIVCFCCCTLFVYVCCCSFFVAVGVCCSPIAVCCSLFAVCCSFVC